MRKELIRGLKGLCCVAVAAAISLTGIQMPQFGGQGSSTVKVAEAASTTGRVPMWAYMKNGSGRLTTYTTNTLKSAAGYIVPGDYCKILAFYSNGSVKVTYPVSKGNRTAYAAMSGFMASTGFTTQTRTLGKKLTAYRRSTGNATIGTVYASDQVLVVGTANGRTQVQYPCSGGYKLGWVPGTYSANVGSNPQGCVDSVSSPSTGKITVTGWAFDRDSLGNSLQVHVYVGGPAGSGAPGYAVTANAYRPDVNKAYPGVGNYHGFNSTISVSKTGSQTIYVYAINVGGGNTNPLLGTKSVNIQGGSTSAGVVANGTYKLVSALNSNYVMDVNGASAANGANVQLYADNNSNAQKFVFTKQSDGYYTIKNAGSGKMLDCYGAGRTNGTNIQQYASNSSAAQRWKVTHVGNGYYTLTCKCNGLLADVSGGRSANGTNIQMYSANGSAAQKWKLVSTSVSNSTSTSNSANASTKAQKIVAYELSQLGIGDTKGNNNVKYNTWYYNRVVSGKGYAWCMAFQSYCADQMGVLNTAIPRMNNCASAVKWYRDRGQFKYGRYYGGNYTPKAGDLVFYYDGSICHVGMITAAPVNGYLQTVEGNIQCSDGNWKVVRFTKNSKRTINNSYVYGYGVPNY